jgi:hypothetical protein
LLCGPTLDDCVFKSSQGCQLLGCSPIFVVLEEQQVVTSHLLCQSIQVNSKEHCTIASMQENSTISISITTATMSNEEITPPTLLSLREDCGDSSSRGTKKNTDWYLC